MDPSGGNQQPTSAMKHIMTVPEKIELTSTGAYPSPPRATGGASGQRSGEGYRAMRVPDKIMLESEGGGGGGGEGESEIGGGGGGGAFPQQQSRRQQRDPPLDPPAAAANREQPPPPPPAMSAVRQTSLERRVTTIENQLKDLQQAVLQGGRGGRGRRREGSRVWYALTFAGWLMVPLVVVFMFHYRKTAH